MGIIRLQPSQSYLALYTGKFIWILSVLYVARQLRQPVDQFLEKRLRINRVSCTSHLHRVLHHQS